MQSNKPMWVFVAISIGLAACGEPPPPKAAHAGEPPQPVQPRPRPAPTDAQRALVDSANAFGWDLFRESSDPAALSNLALSPLSAFAVLGMAERGAAGETATELRRALHLPSDESAFHGELGGLLMGMQAAEPRGYELSIANGVFLDSHFAFRDDFVSDLRSAYGAEVRRLGLIRRPEAVKDINQWVGEATHHQIKHLFDALDETTMAVLVNAVYFEGTWASPFEPAETWKRPFRLSATAVTDVPTMSTSGTFPCSESSGARVLELPYRGEELSFVIVLPGAPGTSDAGGADPWLGAPASVPGDPLEQLRSLEASLSAEQLTSLLRSTRPCRLGVSLPKFELDTRLDLVDGLQRLGVSKAFVLRDADFSRMDGRSGEKSDIFIGQALQRVHIEVNERGTRASAASGLAFEIESVPTPFEVDRPFLFAIQDRLTGALLFLGRVTDPRAKG